MDLEKRMELKIKVNLGQASEIEELMKLIRKIEEEYSCSCTLLEMKID